MKLQELKIKEFKNYASVTLEFSTAVNCLVGLNGMGKTNLLEAIYYLSMSKSNRNLPDTRLMREGEAFFRLEGKYTGLSMKTDQVIAKVPRGGRKEMVCNGVAYERLADHVGRFPVVFISPDDSSLITGGSEDRRRFLDNTLSQLDPEYLQSLVLYNRILKQRNALLKQFLEGRSFQASLLETYDGQLIKPATYIFKARRQLVQSLEPLFQKYYEAISSGHEKAGFFYKTALEASDLGTLLLDSRGKDRIMGRTTQGVHKDDLELELDNLPVRKLASQGQIKSVLLALRLAQYVVLFEKKGVPPLLLLDDIFDKLDERRVEQLLTLLKEEPFGQLFITDAYKHRLPELLERLSLESSFFYINNGAVSQNSQDYGKEQQ